MTGGGTFGHVTPNLALLPGLRDRNYEIIYIGSKDEKEKGIVEKENILFFSITSDKLRRYHDFKNFLMPINVLKGIKEARTVLKNQNVDIVFSKGGYVSLPVVIAASQLKIPVISHEADYTPGLANKFSTPFSTKVCTNFKQTAEMIADNKGIYTGCPIRKELLNGDKNKALELMHFEKEKPILFIVGGSLGSVFINELIRSKLDILMEKFNIIHSCGKDKIDFHYKTRDQVVGFDKYDSYRQFEIITDSLADIYAASDVIISRAGANVIFEILSLAKPNLLIPLSLRASRGDQILNAKSFKSQSFSEVLFEEDITKDDNIFIEKLDTLFENRNFYIEKMKSSKLQNAAEKICEIISIYTPDD